MNLLLVLPVCHKEINQAIRLADWIGRLGGLKKRSILVVYTWKAKWEIEQVIDHLRPVFGIVNSYLLPVEDESGWPVSSNTMFMQTVEYLDQIGNTEPWFWFEVDCCPLSPGWMEALEQEYEAIGKPYMGVVTPSRFMYVRTGIRFTEGSHVTGASIYPADMWQTFPMVRTLSPMAFDVQMGKEMLPLAHDTKLICHRWQTINYRRNEKGEITMDDLDTKENHYGGRSVHPEAVVVHGAKDLSLIDLLEAELDNVQKEGSLISQ
jgi:hypothetical protein